VSSTHATRRAAADNVVEQLVQRDGRAIAVGADVARQGSVARLFEEMAVAGR
jgi:hypothetical protein